jgi:hypothetical protein
VAAPWKTELTYGRTAMQNLAAGVQAMVIYVSGSYVDVFGKTHHVADCLSTVTTEFRPYFASNRHY